MKKYKKLISFLTSASLFTGLPGLLGAAPVDVQAAAMEDHLILDLNFDSVLTGLSGSGAKAKGTFTLQNSYEGAGKAVYLDGSSTNYLTVTKEDGSSLLTDVEEMTISYEYKSDSSGTNWVLYAAPNDNAQVGNNEHYIGAVHVEDFVTAERYNNAGGRPGRPEVTIDSDWTHVDIVMSKEDVAIYVNGTEKERMDSSYALTDILGDNSVLYVGKANWGTGEFCKGWIDNMKIYNKALSAEEIQQVAPEAFADIALPKVAEDIKDVTIDSEEVMLPNYSSAVTWKSDMPEIVIGEDGLTATISQPEADGEPITGMLTAVITKYGKSLETEIPVTINPYINPDDLYGYLMVHFVEDSAGYREKIHLSISRGDTAEQWERLNGGEPILTSHVGTTGVRDPFLTYNPETETYYIIATDLRVFGGNYPNGDGWGYWGRYGSTMMNVWESKDLITWSEVRQIDMSLDGDGNKAVEIGNMYAPETTWVPDFYGEGQGAFVVYWTSEVFPMDDPNHETTADGNILWGVTTDFTQETFEYRGVFLDHEYATWIDTTILQANGKTYHITKSHEAGKEIIMYSTTREDWWNADMSEWTLIQEAIGAGRYGAVEGPAVFKDHNKEDSFYLFVDDLPQPGYQPMYTTDPDNGWDYLDSPDYYLPSYTKHGGIISLTKAQYDAIRKADATSAVTQDLGTVEVNVGQTAEELTALLPETAKVNLAYDFGTSELPVVWDISEVDLNKGGTYEATGVVQSIGANKNQWVGKDGSTSYLAEGKELYSSEAIEVTVAIKVNAGEPIELPYKDVVKGDWFYDAVAYTYYEGLMTGMDAETFGPYGQLSRAQFALILYRMEGENAVTTDKSFKDIVGDEWYGPAVLWAAENGIVTGYQDGNFGPADMITREQMAVMMYRYANYLGKDVSIDGIIHLGWFEGYLDKANISPFATESMYWAVVNGIITGKDAGTKLDPQGNTARCEAALIIQRFMDM